MFRFSWKRPERSDPRLPSSSARSSKKKPDGTTPSRARIEPILLELAPLGMTTITRPLPPPANGWNRDTRNHTQSAATASASSAPTRARDGRQPGPLWAARGPSRRALPPGSHSTLARDGRRRARISRSRSRSSAVRPAAGPGRSPRDNGSDPRRSRGEPALQQVRRGARVLTRPGGAVGAPGDPRGKALVVHLHRYAGAEAQREPLGE